MSALVLPAPEHYRPLLRRLAALGVCLTHASAAQWHSCSTEECRVVLTPDLSDFGCHAAPDVRSTVPALMYQSGNSQLIHSCC
jgi:hypothetical protein